MQADRLSRREFLRAPWKSLAETPHFGVVTIEPQRCTLCGACADRCSAGALVLQQSEQDALTLVFDAARCTACEACVMCPERALSVEKIYDPQRQPPSPAVLVEDEMVRCRGCGANLGPARLRAKIHLVLAQAGEGPECPTCRLHRVVMRHGR